LRCFVGLLKVPTALLQGRAGAFWRSPGTTRPKISASFARLETEIVTRLGALAKLRESHDYEFMTMCRAKPEMLASFAEERSRESDTEIAELPSRSNHRTDIYLSH
jgi:hypothetical protein